MATVLKIEDLGCVDDWVYDLETEDGTFSTAEGIILKNTDSCYVKFDVDKEVFPDNDNHEYMKEHFRLAIECSKRITETFKPPIELEFEKVMSPFLLFAKKRYAYLEWIKPDEPDHVDYKGIQTVRRDNCQYVKDVASEILESLMYDKDVEKAKTIAEKGVINLLEDKVDIKKLIISKSLNKYYKKDGQPVLWNTAEVAFPHVRLAQNLIKIDPMGHPKPPDRVPYVFIETNNNKSLQWERVAHPDYMGKNTLDPLYYLEKQLISPLDMIFEILIDDPSVLYHNHMINRKNKNSGIKDLFNYFGGNALIKGKPKKSRKKKKKNNEEAEKKDIRSFFTV